MKRLQQNNSGFSLIETVVAVAVLAIVTVPLLNTFVMSQKTIRRASDTGNERLAASSVYETIQSASLSTLAPQVLTEDGTGTGSGMIGSGASGAGTAGTGTGGSGAGGAGTTGSGTAGSGTADDKTAADTRLQAFLTDSNNGFGATDAGTNKVSYTVTARTASPSAGTSGRTAHQGGAFTYNLPGIKAGRNTYDCTVTLDPELMTDQTDPASSLYGTAEDNPNAKALTKETSFKNIFLQAGGTGEDPDEKVLSNVPQGADTKTRRITGRQIDLYLSRISTGDAKLVLTPVIRYSYDITYQTLPSGQNGTAETRYIRGISGSDAGGQIEYTLGDITLDAKKPLRIYVFYQPFYGGTATPRDDIRVHNPYGLDGTVCFVKQKTDGLTMSEESSYTGAVSIYEGTAAAGDHYAAASDRNTNLNVPEDLKGQITVYTNMNRILSGSGTGTLQNNVFRVRRFTQGYSYDTEQMTDAGFVSTEDRDRMYLVTIRVYPHADEPHADTEKPLYTLEGIKLG